MTIVADASVVVAALVDNGRDGTWAESQLRTNHLAAPSLMPVEVTNVLRRLERSSLLDRGSANLAFDALGQLTIGLAEFEPLADRIWELRSNLTSYDAFYVALAEALECPLATLDKRLVSTPGPICEFVTP